jgi:hypothetical protein
MAGKGLKGAVFGCLAGKGVSDERNERVWAAILTEDEEQMNAQQDEDGSRCGKSGAELAKRTGNRVRGCTSGRSARSGRIVSGGARDAHGCGNDTKGKYSKDAFRLLQRRYPKSEWTKKTPYWFE